jgi:hypothetical protein
MIKLKKLILVAVCMWLITPAVYGDMTPLSRLGCNLQNASKNLCDESLLPHSNLSDKSVFSGIIDADYSSVGLIPESKAVIEQGSKAGHLEILKADSGSRSLCLYTLIGMGLCSSVTWVKRMSFGFIPEWYHNGGPHQVGHSYAVMPGTLKPVPVGCFVQPDYTGESLLTRCYKEIDISFLRNSQFTKDTLFYRGPPHMAKRIFKM